MYPFDDVLSPGVPDWARFAAVWRCTKCGGAYLQDRHGKWWDEKIQQWVKPPEGAALPTCCAALSKLWPMPGGVVDYGGMLRMIQDAEREQQRMLVGGWR